MRKLAIRFFNDVPVVVLTVIESIIIFAATMVATTAVGSMITIGAFVSALVYFLHNKNNR